MADHLEITVEITNGRKLFYVKLAEGKIAVARTEEFVPNLVLLDFGADQQLLGIEVLAPRCLDRIPEILRKHGRETTAVSWWDFVRAFS